VCARAPIVVADVVNVFIRREEKLVQANPGYKGSSLGGFWMYLEFRRGFADGSNSPRANSKRTIERLPKRTGEDEGYAANLFKEKEPR